MFTRFYDRREAGRILAGKLRYYANKNNVIVLALPHGGVPVAYEVARNLSAPLDVFIVRKLGVPGQEEFGFGAIASGGFRVLNKDVIDSAQVSKTSIDFITERETQELKRRERLYRANRPKINVENKTVIIVDDGLATGATMRAAVNALKAQNPSKIVIAVPIGSQQTCDEFKQDENVNCICAQIPEPLYGVGVWYRDFSQTTDAEVCELLSRAELEQKSARRHAV